MAELPVQLIKLKTILSSIVLMEKTLAENGLINGIGYVLSLCFYQRNWLRSLVVILSAGVATLTLYGSVTGVTAFVFGVSICRPGYVSFFGFGHGLWLRSNALFRSGTLTAFALFGSIHVRGCVLMLYFDPAHWLRSDPLIRFGAMAAFTLLDSFGGAGCVLSCDSVRLSDCVLAR